MPSLKRPKKSAEARKRLLLRTRRLGSISGCLKSRFRLIRGFVRSPFSEKLLDQALDGQNFRLGDL